jgi:hypothetical protein
MAIAWNRLPKPWNASEDSGNCPGGLPWPGLDENADISVLSKEKVEEKATDQRNLITKASIADIAAEVENDRWENVRKLTQAQDVSARTVYAALMRTAKLSKKSARCVNKQFSLEMKKEQFRMC